MEKHQKTMFPMGPIDLSIGCCSFNAQFEGYFKTTSRMHAPIVRLFKDSNDGYMMMTIPLAVGCSYYLAMDAKELQLMV